MACASTGFVFALSLITLLVSVAGIVYTVHFQPRENKQDPAKNDAGDDSKPGPINKMQAIYWGVAGGLSLIACIFGLIALNSCGDVTVQKDEE